MLNRVTIDIGEVPVVCEVINAYQLNLNFPVIVKAITHDENICCIEVGKTSVNLNDRLVVPVDHKINSVYKIRKIAKVTDRVYALLTTTETKSKKFILPCISDNTTTKDYFLYDKFLENAYLDTDADIELGTGYPLILLYRYSDSEIYRQFESRIRKHPLFVKCVDVNNSEVLFIFDVTEYARDIEFFKQGAYSRLSKELKDKIMMFHNFTSSGTMYQILYKSPTLRKQLELKFDVPISDMMELYDRPEMVEETLFIGEMAGG